MDKVKERVVITGIESVIPITETDSLSKMNFNSSPIEFANTTKTTSMINSEIIKEKFSKRIIKKRDNVILYALLTTEKLKEKANLVINENNSENIGIILGNSTGGWGYVENQMIQMYKHGLNEINPYVATSWFPTAAQGEVSIKYGIRGYSKTLCGDRLSGGLALKHAFQTIKNKKATSIITGGIEAPNTPLVFNALGEECLGEGAILTLFESNSEADYYKRKPLAEVIDIRVSSSFENTLKDIAEQQIICDYIYNHKLSKREEEAVRKIKKNNVILDKANYLRIEHENINLISLEVPFALLSILERRTSITGKTVMINCCSSSSQVMTMIIKIY